MESIAYAKMDSNEADHWWFRARREILAHLIERTCRTGDMRILEAGCGTGGNLEMLKRFGDLDAFEYDAQARALACKKSGREIPHGALPCEIPFKDKQYDLIVLFDVLEHIEDDAATLKALGARLAPGGTIMLTVPAMPWLWSAHDTYNHHFRRYTKTSLKRTVDAAGLRAQRTFYFNSLLFPVAVLQRMSKRLTGRDNPDDVQPAPWLNEILYQIFRSERHFLGWASLPAGLSLCAIITGDGTVE
jgi:SAM-dependent methyltransferase